MNIMGEKGNSLMNIEKTTDGDEKTGNIQPKTDAS
jgi:hypothetical protein